MVTHDKHALMSAALLAGSSSSTCTNTSAAAGLGGEYQCPVCGLAGFTVRRMEGFLHICTLLLLDF